MSGYRIAGAIASVVSAVLLVWVAVVSFGREDMVVPEVAVQATAAVQGPTAQEVLQDRTVLQRWRAASGPSPEAEAPAPTPEPEARLTDNVGVENARQLAQSWQQNRPESGDMLRDRGFVEGITSVPYAQANVFQQPQGRDWRRRHNDQIRYGGGWIIFGMALALALFLTFRGRIPLVRGFSGETVERFGSVERANHWMTASSFILMALTGLILLYGKPFIRPLIGHDAFGAFAWWTAWTHMAAAVPFVLGIFMMIVLWVRDNLPSRLDWPWLKEFGGFMKNDDPHHPPARKFNAGQKLMFWGAVLSGLALLASGLALMFPFFWLGYDGMQWAQLAHAAVALLAIALILGHIYIGTVGMAGAVHAMWSGQVDRNWAEEHHSIWAEHIEHRSGRDGG